MKITSRPLFPLLVAWLLLHVPAAATTIGTAPAGPMSSGISAGGYFREWLQLERKDIFLVGTPESGPVAMLALRAPGFQEGHLILRWIERDDGKISMLLAAPKELAAATDNVMLYLTPYSESLELYERNGTTWIHRERHLVHKKLSKETNRSKPFDRFVTTGLGPFWLVPERTIRKDRASEIIPSTSPHVGGSLSRAMANWIWPIALFGAVWSAARLRYRLESRAG